MSTEGKVIGARLIAGITLVSVFLVTLLSMTLASVHAQAPIAQSKKVDTIGTIKEFEIPTFAPRPIGITQGPGGALWFTEFNFGKIGQITSK
jgi:hypothetical protein